MSPSAALESPIFRAYAVLVPALLLLGGIALFALRAAGKRLDGVWDTYRSWLVIAGLLLVAAAAGRAPVVIVLATTSVFAFKEFARATGLYRDWTLCGAAYVMIVAIAVVTLCSNPNHGGDGWYGMFMTIPVFGIA